MVTIVKNKALVVISLIVIVVFGYYFFVHDPYGNVPYYKQDKEYYCGEACIQMVLAFYNVSPPEQYELAQETGFSGNETPCSGMAIPFRKRGFDVTTTNNTNYTGAYSQLIDVVASKPVIVLITWEDGVGHYIVVVQCDKRGITYRDPKYGRIRYRTYDAFKLLWYDNCKASGRVTCWALWVQDK